MMKFLPLLALIYFCVPASAAISVTSKTCVNSAASGTTVACTWSSAPVSGETVFCATGNDHPYTGTVTDSASNTYTANGARYHSSSQTFDYQMWYFTLTGSITTETYNAGGSTNYPYIACISATGVATSSTTDGYSTVDQSLVSATLATWGSITTTGNGDLVFCSAAIGGGQTIGAGSGFTLTAVVSVNNATQYQIQTSSGAIAPTMTASATGSDSLAGVCVAYKATGGGGGGASASYVASAGNNTTSISYTCATTGNILHAAAWTDGGSAPLTISNTPNALTWNSIANIASSATAAQKIADWWTTCANTSATTVSFANGSNDVSIAIAEYTFSGTLSLDTSTTYGTGGTTTSPYSLTASAAVAHELAIGSAGNEFGTRVTTSDTGWTARAPGGGSAYVTLLDKLDLSSGSNTVNITNPSGGSKNLATVGFLSSSGGGGGGAIASGFPVVY